MYDIHLSKLNSWAKDHLAGLFIFNSIIIILVLLNTAQYFKPFFFLSINVIFFISLVLAILLLGARSRAMFFISSLFFVFGVFLKIANIDIWADRASIYFYQAFFVGILLLLIKK